MLGGWLDLMILEVFSNLNDSMILLNRSFFFKEGKSAITRLKRLFVLKPSEVQRWAHFFPCQDKEVS